MSYTAQTVTCCPANQCQNFRSMDTLTELRGQFLGKLLVTCEQKLLTLFHKLFTAVIRLILWGFDPIGRQKCLSVGRVGTMKIFPGRNFE